MRASRGLSAEEIDELIEYAATIVEKHDSQDSPWEERSIEKLRAFLADLGVSLPAADVGFDAWADFWEASSGPPAPTVDEGERLDREAFQACLVVADTARRFHLQNARRMESLAAAVGPIPEWDNLVRDEKRAHRARMARVEQARR